MADAHAAAVYRQTGLPVPQRERVCRVNITSRDLQPELLESYADKLAATVVTAAMTQGVTRIELHFPGRQAVTLDADAIRTACAIESGFWPSPDPIRSYGSVYNLARLGAQFEPWNPMVAVPAQIKDVSHAVSGDEPAVKEV